MSEIKPPNNLAAEAAVLGAILFDNHAFDRVRSVLQPDDFYAPAHQTIYENCAVLIEQGRAADGITLEELFESEDDLSNVGGAEYLSQLLDNAALGPEVQDYARMVRDLAVRRELLNMGLGLQSSALRPEDGKTGEAMVRECEDWLQAIDSRRVRSAAWEQSAYSVTRLIADLDDRLRNGKPDEVAGLKTGIPDLDKRIAGLRRGNLIVVAGRPGMAKSGVAVNIAASVAGDISHEKIEGAPNTNVVGVFQLEMDTSELDLRLAAQMARKTGAGRVEYVKAIDGDMGQNEFAILAAGAKAFPASLHVDTTPNLTAGDIAARARNLKRKVGRLDLIVIDYLQIMNLAMRQRESKTDAVGRTTTALKRLAKELGIPIIILSQLSRECERRDNKRPILSDLRDSGAIEQDADVVIFVYRDEYYLAKSEPPHGSTDNPKAAEKWNDWYRDSKAATGVMELIVDKVRMGKVGTTRCHYEAETDTLISSKAELEQLDDAGRLM